MRFHARKSSGGASSSNNNTTNTNTATIATTASSANTAGYPSNNIAPSSQTTQKPLRPLRTNTAPEAPAPSRFPSTRTATTATTATATATTKTHSAFASTSIISPGGLLSGLSGLGGRTSSISSKRSRRATATGPSTPTLRLTPSQTSASASLPVSSPSAATSPSSSYFNPQPTSSGKEPRSPTAKRPPAWNASGVDNSRGPPITLITRGTAADIARRTQQQPQQQQHQGQQQQQHHQPPPPPPPSQPQSQPQSQSESPPSPPPVAEFAFAQQQQLLRSGLLSQTAASQASRSSAGQETRRRLSSGESAESASPPTQTNIATPRTTLFRHNSARAARRELPMDSPEDDYSEYGSGSAVRSQTGDIYPRAGTRATDTSGTDGEPNEDLFLKIAADSSPRDTPADTVLRSDRLRSRLARPSNRQSFPSASASPAVQSVSAAPHTSKVISAIDTKSSVQHRRASTFSTATKTQREESPLTPGLAADMSRSRQMPLSPKASFSSKKDQELSPHQFLAQISNSRRRPSNPDVAQTPPNRIGTYRPSNLNYSASRDQDETPSHVTSRQEASSRADGTESLDSTGPAASVWDELDELKSRIRRIELGGKMPTTSGAVVANASDRPRTATTSVTTASSSPKQQRKPNDSPAESVAGVQTPQRIHPLLRDALRKTKHYVSPGVYRSLEAAATEALQLAELAGSAGGQGGTPTANSVPNGTSIPDRQVRRKADNLCRSLTDLCIELCDTKASVASPAMRSAAAAASRRPSLQVNGESPSIRQSIEPESDSLVNNSPSRALTRIEARRASGLASIGGTRESSQEPSTPSQSQIPTRLTRAGTSLQRKRHKTEEDDDPTLRAPSRAMTDFRDTRSANSGKRVSKEYTSQEPMPDLQAALAFQQSAFTFQRNPTQRRPTVSGGETTNILFQGSQRYNINRQSSPAFERQPRSDAGSRLSQPTPPFGSHRVSVGTVGLGRTSSLSSKRFRGVAAE